MSINLHNYLFSSVGIDACICDSMVVPLCYFCTLPRYDEIESKMTPFLRSSGYNVKKGMREIKFDGFK